MSKRERDDDQLTTTVNLSSVVRPKVLTLEFNDSDFY